jgi:hypothetical protein
MSLQLSRRSLLGVAGTTLATGLAGCEFRRSETDTPTPASPPTDQSPSGTPTNGTEPGPPDEQTTATQPAGQTYGIEIRNRIAEADFENVPGLSGPEPAVIEVRVSNLNPDSEEAYFEEAVELDPGGAETFPDAFTVRPNGPTYAMSARFEPFVQGGLSSDRNRRASRTFIPGGDRMPQRDPISVNVVNLVDMPDINITGSHGPLYPTVFIRA